MDKFMTLQVQQISATQQQAGSTWVVLHHDCLFWHLLM